MKQPKRYIEMPAWVWRSATLAALLHAGAWGGWFYAQAAQRDARLVQRPAEVVAMSFTNHNPRSPARPFWRLYLTLRLADAPGQPAQDMQAQDRPIAELREYSERHRIGDVVPVWVDSGDGRIHTIFAPQAPDWKRYALWALATVGLATWAIVFAAGAYASARHVSNKGKHR